MGTHDGRRGRPFALPVAGGLGDCTERAQFAWTTITLLMLCAPTSDHQPLNGSEGAIDANATPAADTSLVVRSEQSAGALTVDRGEQLHGALSDVLACGALTTQREVSLRARFARRARWSRRV